MGYGATPQNIKQVNDDLNSNHRQLVDGYEFVFYVSGSLDRKCKETTMQCIYPTFTADDEMQKLQKDNLRLLNQLLKESLKSKDKENISILRKIFRKLKLERLSK